MAAILVHCAMIIIMRCIIIIYNYIITVGWGLVADDVILPVGGINTNTHTCHLLLYSSPNLIILKVVPFLPSPVHAKGGPEMSTLAWCTCQGMVIAIMSK